MAKTVQSSKFRVQSSKLSKTSKSSSSMGELLKRAGYVGTSLKKGEKITGTISSMSPKQILIDINGKAEAVVLEKDKRILTDLLKTLKVGDQVLAQVLNPESDQGFPVVSLRAFRSRRAWDELKSLLAKDESVEVEIVEETRGGLLVDVFGIQGFIPSSHLLEPHERLSVGLKITAKIIELDPVADRLILSQKLALVKKADVSRLLSQIKIGQTYKGAVSGITKFGIFVTLTEGEGIDFSKASIEGLVHISEISWEKIDDLSKMFAMGDEIEVMVIGIDKKNQKLNLSLKQLMADPFAAMAEKFHQDQEVKGTITRVSRFGVFVELEQGVEGLIHQSKIPPQTKLLEGQKITCVVESVDTKRRRIALIPVLKEKPVGYR